MSFLNRMMASVGIGGAKVDTLLHNAEVRAGETLAGVVRIKGGSLEQQVDAIYLTIMTQYVREVNDRRVRESVALAKVEVTRGFTLNSGETKEIPFQFTLPEETPVTVGHTPVWVRTGLDIAMAVDPSDEDRLHVRPHRNAQMVMDALDAMGFRLRHTEVEYTRRLGRSFPFVQEFEYVPQGQFRGRLDELEVVLQPDATGVDIIMEVDRRARGFMGLLESALDADETRLRFRFDREHLATGVNGVAGYLQEIIGRHAR